MTDPTTTSPRRRVARQRRALLVCSVDESAWLRSPAATSVQNDRPDAFVQTLMHALDAPEDAAAGALSEAVDASVLVDRSCTELPDAAHLIAQRAPIPDQGP